MIPFSLKKCMCKDATGHDNIKSIYDYIGVPTTKQFYVTELPKCVGETLTL